MLTILYVRLDNGKIEEWEDATPIVMHDAGNMLRIESLNGEQIYAYYAAWAAVWSSSNNPRGFEPHDHAWRADGRCSICGAIRPEDEPVGLPMKDFSNTLGDGHDHMLQQDGVCVLCGAFGADT
jgi:hypothetical protein